MLRPKHGGNLSWAAAVAGCEPQELLDFSASISPLGPPASVLQALHDNLAVLLSAYPNPDYGSLRSCLADYHGLESEWVLPGNGAAELLTWAARDLAGCDRVYFLTPGFGDYGRSLRAFGAKVEHRPLAVDSLFDSGLSDLEVRAGTDVAANWGDAIATLPPLGPQDGMVLNNPHNPTGYLWGAEVVRSRLDQGGLVVVDEAFMDFLPPEQQQSVVGWVQAFPNLVVLRSLTKFYSLAGLRLGYALLHPQRAERWQQWRDPWPVNGLAAIAAEVALKDLAFQQQTWDWLPAARQVLVSGLRDLAGLEVYSGCANFLLVRSRHSCVQLQRQLLQRDQILIRDCLSFEGLGDRFFRIAVRRPEENQRLLTALGNRFSAVGSP
ncbi:MAG: threonine-phosphate decarboxylase [Synechococcales cyanobacterium CRU_2_2]|nr:threonine-phosphate decarboxylase [Synechococcales cyanobacterium CRU_2_2]